MDSRIFQVVADVGGKRATVIEEMIELHLQPKPKWMPKFLWKFLLRRMLILTEGGINNGFGEDCTTSRFTREIPQGG